MKKIYAIIVTAIIAAWVIYAFTENNDASYLLESNVEALASGEDNARPLGYHLEPCGALFFKFGTHPSNCVRPLQVCDHDSNIGCDPKPCSGHY